MLCLDLAIKPQNCEHLLFLLTNYKFKSFTLQDICITAHVAKYLENCHTLILSNKSISEIGIKFIHSCHLLYITHADISDEDAQQLEKCNILVFLYSNISNTSIEWLESRGCIVYNVLPGEK